MEFLAFIGIVVIVVGIVVTGIAAWVGACGVSKLEERIPQIDNAQRDLERRLLALEEWRDS